MSSGFVSFKLLIPASFYGLLLHPLAELKPTTHVILPITSEHIYMNIYISLAQSS